MAGIYIHIPFCRQACSYCDFHFSTNTKNSKDFLLSLHKEIEMQKNYLSSQNINTIYFGGGTPSLLSANDICLLIDKISKYFFIDKNAEITLEANPDDLTTSKIKEFSVTPVNRLSIGIQSFREEDLIFLNRAHNAKQAIESVKHAQEAGFKNITIDLIYGTQTMSNEEWEKNLSIAFDLKVQHLSCYSLTIEPRTPLSSYIKKGTAPEVDPQKSAQQFEILMDQARRNDFIHYEISNFCTEGHYSKHNSSYWKGNNYLGLGPSAHSFDGNSRQWNVKSNAAYISTINARVVPFQLETLTVDQKYNEYILTTLRTIWGLEVKTIADKFGDAFLTHFTKEIEKHLHNNMVFMEGDVVALTQKGKLFSDTIASDLFVV